MHVTSCCKRILPSKSQQQPNPSTTLVQERGHLSRAEPTSTTQAAATLPLLLPGLQVQTQEHAIASTIQLATTSYYYVRHITIVHCRAVASLHAAATIIAALHAPASLRSWTYSKFARQALHCLPVV